MFGAEQDILLSNCNLVYWHMYTPLHLYKLKTCDPKERTDMLVMYHLNYHLVLRRVWQA